MRLSGDFCGFRCAPFSFNGFLHFAIRDIFVIVCRSFPGMGSIPVARAINPVDAVGFMASLLEMDP